MKERIEVLIIDEHSAVCEALASRLKAFGSIRVVGACCNYHEGKCIAERTDPDIILLELKSGARGGRLQPAVDPIRAVSELAQSGRATVLVLTSYPDEVEQNAALQAGASRYLLKDIDTARLVAEIEQAAHERFVI